MVTGDKGKFPSTVPPRNSYSVLNVQLEPDRCGRKTVPQPLDSLGEQAIADGSGVTADGGRSVEVSSTVPREAGIGTSAIHSSREGMKYGEGLRTRTLNKRQSQYDCCRHGYLPVAHREMSDCRSKHSFSRSRRSCGTSHRSRVFTSHLFAARVSRKPLTPSQRA